MRGTRWRRVGFAGGSWGKLSCEIRGKRENFAGARLRSGRRDSRRGAEAESLPG